MSVWTYQDGPRADGRRIVIAEEEINDEATARARATVEILKHNRRRKAIKFSTWRPDLRVGEYARVQGVVWWITSVVMKDDGASTIYEIEGERYE